MVPVSVVCDVAGQLSFPIWHWMPLQVVPPPGQAWFAGQAVPPGQVAGQSSALPQPLPIGLARDGRRGGERQPAGRR